MALVLGTNCGFVTVAPSTAPGGNQTQTVDSKSAALAHAAPASGTVTEMGWYTGSATEEADFELGLYSDAGAGEPELRLNVTAATAKGTGSGWKVITGLSFAITSGTTYWLAVQLDNTATATTIDEETTGGSGNAMLAAGQTSLIADWGVSDTKNSTRSFSIYALYTVGASVGAGINRGRINAGLINHGLVRV